MTVCYVLNMKCPPKGLCIEGWFPAGGAILESSEILGRGPKSRKQVMGTGP
jgi:hypothetical protein